MHHWNMNTYFPNALFAIVYAVFAVWLAYNSSQPNHATARPCKGKDLNPALSSTS
jgi:hypothetical protein